MFEWIGGHWFQLLVVGGFVAVLLSLFKMTIVIASTTHDWSQVIEHRLGEIRNDLGEIERALKEIDRTLAFRDERDRETRDKFHED